MVEGASPSAELVARDLSSLGTMERAYRFPHFSLSTAVRWLAFVALEVCERSHY
jgi:hypothetical protein